MKKYKVKEIFGPTIQGEGSFTGLPVMFLRFSGCNKWSGRKEDKEESICRFCDTDFVGGDLMTADEIINALNKHENKNLVISGGEPTLQLDIHLVKKLKKENYKIHLETNGSKNIDEYDEYLDHVTLSPKQSWEQTRLSKCDDLKILYPWISEDITYEKFANYEFKKLYIQPQWGSSLEDTLDIIYKIGEANLSAQLHKLLELA